VKLLGAWNGTRALAHCTRIDGEGVAKCSGKFSEEIKVHLARLRGEFFTWKKQRGSDKVIANERTAESRIETAVGVESRAVRSSSSRDVSSQAATSSIASALSSANSTYLSVAVADLIFGDALPTSLLYNWLDALAKSDFHEDPQFDGF